MIKKEGDYLVIQPNQPQHISIQKQHQQAPKDQVLTEVGDVKAYLNSIASKIREIKAAKIRKSQQNKSEGIFEKLGYQNEGKNLGQRKIQLQIKIPDQIYKLDERLRKIEDKINNDEIFRQKVQRKGTLTQRIKSLHFKVQKLAQKSPQIIYNNIQNYCIGFDEKQTNMKVLYLYDSFSKTQGINEQISVLQVYLQTLNKIQTKIKGMNSASSIVKDHNGLTEKRAQLSAKIHSLFVYMKKQYDNVAKQIDQI